MASLAFFGSEVFARRIKIGSLGTGHILPRVAKAKGRGIMDMRSLLPATRPQRQGLLQAGAMAMAATHEQAINQSWAQVRESTAQAQGPTDATVISPGKKNTVKRKKGLYFLCNVSPAAPLEEKLSICAPPEPVVAAADPRNEQEGGGGGGDALSAAPKNPSRPVSIAGGDVRGGYEGLGAEASWGSRFIVGDCRIGERR